MSDNDRLRRHLELCARDQERKRREAVWQWPDQWSELPPGGAKRRPSSCSARTVERPKVSSPEAPEPSHHHGMMSAPVLHLDNSSSGSNSVSVLMTVADVATHLKISQSGVRRLQHARHLPFIKIGGCVRFARRDLIVYLAKRRIEPLDPNI